MLTIDSSIQNIAETAAAEYIDCGAVVVTDVESGEVRAMVSLPNYDRNDIAAVLNDENSPLINRAISAYNAGSVFKPVIAAAALESGFDPNAEYTCTGTVQIGNVTMGCINHTAHENVTMRDAVSRSCNTYFINASSAIGAESILNMAQKLGFGNSVELAHEYRSVAGTLPSLESLKSPAALANFSFGQGDLTVTPLQIAAMFTAIARGGEYIEPSVVKGLTDENLNIISAPKKAVSNFAMSSETASILGEYLRTAVLEGTAKAGASDKVTSAAKTGTAETGIIKNGRAINQAWYAGYFPYENPKYVCVVLAEDGTSGGASAGPIFKEIAERISAASL
jgi:penicillin-binding protein 2